MTENRDDRAINADPDAQADDMFIDGLLSYTADRNETARAARLGKAMNAIAKEAGKPAGRRESHRFGYLVAGLALFLGLFSLLMVQRHDPARASLVRSIEAFRASDQTRYEYRVYLRPNEPPRPQPDAIVDMQGSGSYVLQHRPPGSLDMTFAGNDEQGTWAVAPDGTLDRSDPSRLTPPWINRTDIPLLRGLDDLLSQFLDGYTLTENIHADGSRCIIATFDESTGPAHPSTATIEIEKASGLPSSITLKWGQPMRNPGKFNPRPPLARIEITRVESVPSDANWFDGTTHDNP